MAVTSCEPENGVVLRILSLEVLICDSFSFEIKLSMSLSKFSGCRATLCVAHLPTAEKNILQMRPGEFEQLHEGSIKNVKFELHCFFGMMIL